MEGRIMSTTIVVPLSGPRTDRSRLSERAIPYAKSLARRTRSSVLLVSVVDVPIELSAYYSLPVIDPATDKGPVAERKRYLAQLASSFEDVPVQIAVHVGDPADEIISLVEKLSNTVIVLASHGRVGAGRAILGSVAFSIVHGVGCPVLIVPTLSSEYHVPVLPERGTSLVPLDGSFFSESALSRPRSVLGKPDFALHLLYVVVPATDVMGLPIEAFVGPKEEWATHYLQSVAERLSRQGHLVTWSLRLGDVPEEILSVAKEIDADVIAMATHGRHGVGRMLFGSVTERIAHEANVPLLLIHPDDKTVTEETVDESEDAGARQAAPLAAM
jgi:nucleotide-binding universal stress UspA family protein